MRASAPQVTRLRTRAARRRCPSRPLERTPSCSRARSGRGWRRADQNACRRLHHPAARHALLRAGHGHARRGAAVRIVALQGTPSGHVFVWQGISASVGTARGLDSVLDQRPARVSCGLFPCQARKPRGPPRGAPRRDAWCGGERRRFRKRSKHESLPYERVYQIVRARAAFSHCPFSGGGRSPLARPYGAFWGLRLR